MEKTIKIETEVFKNAVVMKYGEGKIIRVVRHPDTETLGFIIETERPALEGETYDENSKVKPTHYRIENGMVKAGIAYTEASLELIFDAIRIFKLHNENV